MAKLAESKIKFTFVTEGDKAYIATQKKVSKENKSLQKEIKKLTKQVNLHEGAIKNLKPAIEKTSTSTKKFGQACKKTAADQKILNKESDIAYRNNRNLLGSFSVLRSKLLLATFAMTALSRTVGRFVKESADVEETLNKFNVVFGKSSDRALEFSETLAEGVGRSKFMLQEMLATLQDTFVPLGFARDKSADLSMALTKLAVDVASFQNKADDEVVKAFTSALVGNHEAVRAYGITITQAMLQQAALEKGIIDTEREMTAQEKVLARLVIIYNATRDAEGDALKTKESYTNQLKAFNAQLEELRVRIGDTIEPFAALLLKLAGHFANVAVLKGYASALGVVAVGFTWANIQAGRFLFNVAAVKLALARTGIGILVVGVGELAARTIFADDALKDFNDSIDNTVPSLDEMIEGMKGARIEMEGMTRAIAIANILELDAQIGDFTAKIGLLHVELEGLNKGPQTDSFKEELAELLNADIDARTAQIAALEARVKAYEGYLKNTIDQELSFRDEVKKLGLSELEYKKYLLGKRVQAYRDAGVEEIALNKFHKDSLAKLEVEAAEKTDKLRERQAEKLISAENRKASIRAEYNERFLEMTKGSYELQSIELDNAVDRFREAGVEENEIARFTKEAKEQLYLNTAQSFASSVAGNLAIMTKAGMITGKEAKRAAQAQAIVDTYAAANAAYKAMAGIPVIGPGLGALAATTAIAAGIANVRMIESQSFAQGGDFVTSGPQMIAVGDNPGGRERVQVTPLSSPNIDGPQGGITINISAPLVDETVVDSIIPAIEKAQRLNLA